MTTEAVSLVELARRDDPYPDAPQRDDMQNSIYLYEIGTTATLKEHFGNPDSTLVRNEARLGPSLSAPRDTRVPDLMVAFDCHVARVQEDNGYCLESQPHPPEFVLEVASKTTGITDYTDKRADYARYGVGEYWRFDPTGGDYHDDALAGDRLVGGRYVRIPIERIDDEHRRGYSEALGLYVCWEREVLRFYDPVARRYLRTVGEEIAERRRANARADVEAEGRRMEAVRADMEAESRRRAEARAEAAEARAEDEAEGRRLADARAEDEAERRRQAEARADAVESRIAEMERERRGGGG